MSKSASLTIAGRYDQVQSLCAFVAQAAQAAGLAGDVIFHLELCCDEASTNIIEHAYGGEDVGNIQATCEATPEAFRVVLRDHGQPFDPSQVPHPPQLREQEPDGDASLTDVLDHLQVGGLGIHFMRQLMDEVHYSFDDTDGNKLVLVKYITAGAGE